MSKQSLLISISNVFLGGMIGTIFISFFVVDQIAFQHCIRGYFFGMLAGIIPSIIYIFKNFDKKD